MGKGVNVGIFGATGQVGGVMRSVLAERNFPVDRMRYFASPRSVGKRLPWAGEGIEVEVIDPRGVRPLDVKTILDSVRKTGRVVLVHEAAKAGGPGAEVAAIIADQALDSLAAPIKRIGAPDVPIPQSMYLERLVVPDVSDIVVAVNSIVPTAKVTA